MKDEELKSVIISELDQIKEAARTIGYGDDGEAMFTIIEHADFIMEKLDK